MTGQGIFNALHTKEVRKGGCRFNSKREEEMDEETRWYGFAGQVHRSRHPRDRLEQSEL